MKFYVCIIICIALFNSIKEFYVMWLQGVLGKEEKNQEPWTNVQVLVTVLVSRCYLKKPMRFCKLAQYSSILSSR